MNDAIIQFPTKCTNTDTDAFVRSTCEKLMESVLLKISEYKKEWKTLDNKKKNKLALFKANFAVDYFCSNVIAFCDSVYKNYKETDTVVQIGNKLYKNRELWMDANSSYSVFKNMNDSYDKSLEDAMRIFNNMVQEFKLQNQNPNRSELYIIAHRIINAYSSYYPSGYGMYRLAKMQNFKYTTNPIDLSRDQIKESKCPCSCICNSLLFLTLLLVNGVKSKYLYFVSQKHKSHAVYNTKQTHWAARVLCENLFKIDFNLIHDFDSSEYPLNSMVTFDKFTSEFISYYLRNLDTKKRFVKRDIIDTFWNRLDNLI